MGWDVVQIGLRHDLPVNDPFATAKEVAKRTNRNIRLVYEKARKNGYQLTELCKYEINSSNDYLRMIAYYYHEHQTQKMDGKARGFIAGSKQEGVKSMLDYIEDLYVLYEIEDDEESFSIKVFKENVNLDVSIGVRWNSWEKAFHSPEDQRRDYLYDCRMKIYNQAKLFGCNEVIICSDQGPTERICENMNYSADNLKEYVRSYKYLKGNAWLNKKEDEWKKHAKHIMFSSVFQNQLILSDDDIVEVIYDDFSDIKQAANTI
jgi:hypothetical protein